MKYSSNAGPLSDLYLYDPASLIWKDLSSFINPTIPVRFNHCLMSARGKLFLYGGLDGSGEAMMYVSLNSNPLLPNARCKSKALRSPLMVVIDKYSASITCNIMD